MVDELRNMFLATLLSGARSRRLRDQEKSVPRHEFSLATDSLDDVLRSVAAYFEKHPQIDSVDIDETAVTALLVKEMAAAHGLAVERGGCHLVFLPKDRPARKCTCDNPCCPVDERYKLALAEGRPVQEDPMESSQSTQPEEDSDMVAE